MRMFFSKCKARNVSLQRCCNYGHRSSIIGHQCRCLNHGFTLVEVIVSLGVFIVVLFIGVSSLLNILTVYRITEASRNVMDNLNFALESMARTMRFGMNYHCDDKDDHQTPVDSPRNCVDGDDFIAFSDLQNSGAITAFRFNDDSLERSTSCLDTGCSSWQKMVAPEVEIDASQSTFFVEGTGSDGAQPKIFILIKGTAGVREKEKVDFNIQTLVSQRIFDTDE